MVLMHSTRHPKIKLVLGFPLLIFVATLLNLNVLVPQPAFGTDVTLAWDAVTDSRVHGYTVRYRPADGDYTTIPVGNVTTCPVPGLNYDTLYYFSIKAYGNSAESPFSDEVPHTTPPDPKTCKYSLSSRAAFYDWSGGAGNVTVSAPPRCPWRSPTPPGWLNLTSGASGAGNGTVVYSVAPNNGSGLRTAGIKIADQVFTVIQAGLPGTQ